MCKRRASLQGVLPLAVTAHTGASSNEKKIARHRQETKIHKWLLADIVCNASGRSNFDCHHAGSHNARLHIFCLPNLCLATGCPTTKTRGCAPTQTWAQARVLPHCLANFALQSLACIGAGRSTHCAKARAPRQQSWGTTGSNKARRHGMLERTTCPQHLALARTT